MRGWLAVCTARIGLPVARSSLYAMHRAMKIYSFCATCEWDVCNIVRIYERPAHGKATLVLLVSVIAPSQQESSFIDVMNTSKN
jgi:hypothetical protein